MNLSLLANDTGAILVLTMIAFAVGIIVVKSAIAIVDWNWKRKQRKANIKRRLHGIADRWHGKLG